MKNSVGMLSYGKSGNDYNVKKALEKAGAEVSILNTPDDFSTIDKIVLPGVGCFSDAMRELDGIKKHLIEEIHEKPCLGICLGMQILSRVGYEFGETEGLCLVDAEVKKMEVKGQVPHLGWGQLKIVKDSPILKNITDRDKFYFMHSYEVVNYTDIIALTEYSNHKFVSAVQNDNIYGVQFHPEKSRDKGIIVLKNFINI